MSNDDIEMSRLDGRSSPRFWTTGPRTDTHSRVQRALNEGSSSVSNGRQMKREFGSLSILSLSITLLASWESIANSIEMGLINGGPAGLVWGMVLSLTGTMAMALSLAELASICPLAGAQYHWTAMLAPPKVQAFSTWMQGWITLFGWQASVTSICYLVATQIQGICVLNYPGYHAEQWQGTLLMWAIILLSGVINAYGIKIMPALQLLGGIMHVIFFIAIVVPLVLLARRSTPQFVFTELSTTEIGWHSNGVSWCLGMLTVAYCFLGFDGAIHMSEEVSNAAIVIPRVIVQTIAINGLLAFTFLIVVLFCIGNVESVLGPSYTFPMIGIFMETTRSIAAATAMQTSITLIGLVSNIGVVASVSRLTWAFARDGGLPFSSYFAYVDRKQRVPIRAIQLVCGAVIILSLINVVSETALSAILALSTSSLYISYLIPIAMMLICRLQPDKIIRFGPWSLGRYGLLINTFALAFGIFVCIFVPFPTELPVTATNMNWSGPVFVGVCILLCIDWVFRAKHKYVVPSKDFLQSKI